MDNVNIILKTNYNVHVMPFIKATSVSINVLEIRILESPVLDMVLVWLKAIKSRVNAKKDGQDLIVLVRPNILVLDMVGVYTIRPLVLVLIGLNPLIPIGWVKLVKNVLIIGGGAIVNCIVKIPTLTNRIKERMGKKLVVIRMEVAILSLKIILNI